MTEKEILQQQESNKQTVFYLIAVGMFYHAYGCGASALARATGYRVLRKHRKGGDILVCGFPANQLDTVLQRIRETGGEVEQTGENTFLFGFADLTVCPVLKAVSISKAFGGDEAKYDGLNAALATAGGDSSKLQEGDYGYWSSTPNAKDYAWRVGLYDGDAHWGVGAMGWDGLRVRACLAFAVEQAVTPDTPTHKYVDLGLSVKWATCNVGAEKPEEYGDYFAWGETAAKSNYSWSTYKFTTDGGDTFTKYTGSDKTVLDATDDAATVNWGIAWRMPTLEEMKELLNNENCTWEWQAAGNTTFGGVAGYKVTSKKAGYTDKYIFLPAAGGRYGTDMRDGAGSWGRYWSSSLYAGSPMSADDLYFDSEVKAWWGDYYDRCYGHSVRPVLKN